MIGIDNKNWTISFSTKISVTGYNSNASTLYPTRPLTVPLAKAENILAKGKMLIKKVLNPRSEKIRKKNPKVTIMTIDDFIKRFPENTATTSQ
jgi:hypothetical protein